MLKVWGRATSINVQKVMWTLAELGLPHERIDIGGHFGKLDTPEFIRMNPNKRIPLLDDDGFLLWESNAIVRYLAETYGRGSLAPAGRLSFARADQWSDWAITTLYHDLILTCFVGMILKAKAERDAAGIAAAARRIGANLAILDAQLEGKAFLLGDTFSFADVLVGTYMFRYFNLGIERPRLPNVQSWYQRLTARSAYQTHVMIDFSGMKVAGA